MNGCTRHYTVKLMSQGIPACPSVQANSRSILRSRQISTRLSIATASRHNLDLLCPSVYRGRARSNYPLPSPDLPRQSEQACTLLPTHAIALHSSISRKQHLKFEGILLHNAFSLSSRPGLPPQPVWKYQKDIAACCLRNHRLSHHRDKSAKQCHRLPHRQVPRLEL